ncbi:hypothetical protein ASD44_07125 [Mesorhizobium sp. Root554]|uniref:hypothetical protein n=1 Tax=unclassified Mesorhizobium TaxID=325217 RepID=UPI000700E5E4|nr:MULTISPECIES: hypothetical protein [unclassified Mesorhizobium]KQZ13871.1 hypothetical protein ASD27_07130 [Mesorhizobium sp. Root1471]KQZ36383.1 hypothetical protein ASD44_07125 [Mesorhizobium sp. Root554]
MKYRLFMIGLGLYILTQFDQVSPDFDVGRNKLSGAEAVEYVANMIGRERYLWSLRVPRQAAN